MTNHRALEPSKHARQLSRAGVAEVRDLLQRAGVHVIQMRTAISPAARRSRHLLHANARRRSVASAQAGRCQATAASSGTFFHDGPTPIADTNGAAGTGGSAGRELDVSADRIGHEIDRMAELVRRESGGFGTACPRLEERLRRDHQDVLEAAREPLIGGGAPRPRGRIHEAYATTRGRLRQYRMIDLAGPAVSRAARPWAPDAHLGGQDPGQRRAAVLLLGRADLGRLWQMARTASIGQLAGAPLLYLIACSSPVALVMLPRAAHCDRIRSLVGQLVATFFNNFLPSNIGGDGSNPRHGQAAGSKTWRPIVLVDRGIGLMGLVFVAAIGPPPRHG